MKDLPSFKINNPSGTQEKLIAELINSLDQTTHVFLKLNHKGNINHEMFVALRDASIGYCGAMIRDLTKLLIDKSQMKDFITEAYEIFNAYINDIKNDIKQD